MSEDNWALALHGGAGVLPRESYALEEAHLSALLDEGARLLQAGQSALDVVTAMVAELEACALHVAGKGSAPNAAGEFELDAAIMEGHSRRAGAVAALQNMVSPIRAARAVMELSAHVMLAGEGAERFAKAAGIECIPSPQIYYTPVKSPASRADQQVGTVGAVARDRLGRLAAATSTGGVENKLPGRVGDSPIIGAGCWADEHVAVSCTGVGEFFIRAAAAHEVSARMRLGGSDLAAAARAALDTVKSLGGDGGLIAVDRDGAIAMPFLGQGMKRACITATGRREVATFPLKSIP